MERRDTRAGEDLDAFIGRKVEQYCSPAVPVAEMALRELRPVFAELLRVRVALEDLLMYYDAAVPANLRVALEHAREALDPPTDDDGAA